jgi:hypothetical protein
MYALWLDPGVTTGWALYSVGDSERPWLDQRSFGDLATDLDAFMLAAGPATALGVERFILTSVSARRPGSVEAIQAWGVARAMAHLHGAGEFVDDQTSAMAKSFSTDDRLRALGWYTPGAPHANDAARHLLLWLVRRELLTDDQREVLRSLL